jgi:hypothetical protein
MAANNNPTQGSGRSKAEAAGGTHVKPPGTPEGGGAKLDPAQTSNTRMSAETPAEPQVTTRH